MFVGFKWVVVCCLSCGEGVGVVGVFRFGVVVGVVWFMRFGVVVGMMIVGSG